MTRVTTSIDQAIAQSERLIGQGQHLAAVNILQPQLNADPANYWLNFHLGTAYSRLGDRESATVRLLAAASSNYSEPVGALYELVRQDLSYNEFSRIGLLDEALAIPGDLRCKFPVVSQKQLYYHQIIFLKALAALSRGDYDAAERHLRDAYEFSCIPNERSFAFGWVLELLRSARDLSDHPHLEYARQIFLRENMTDAIRYDDLLNRIDHPVDVVEIGAMDGVRFDPLHRHLVENRWNAIVVEPLTDMFELLQRNYENCERVRCANVAISEVTGPLVMFRVNPEIIQAGAPDWLLGISSALIRPDLAYFESAVLEQVVRGLTFESFVDEFDIKNIDILQIDTEGYDWRILQQVDLERWKISVIHVELVHVEPPNRLKAFETLRRAGYAFTYDGMNLTAALGRA
jgi:FkbM family methyltransferase